MGDVRIETWETKQIAFDYATAQAMTEGEEENDAYTIHCFTPLQRWLLLSLISFYPIFSNRWSDDWPSEEKDQLVSETTRKLVTFMACETDITRIADILEAQLPQLTTINSKLDLVITAIDNIEGTLDTRLTEVVSGISDIKVQIGTSTFEPNIIDQVEEILNGAAVILGASGVPVLP